MAIRRTSWHIEKGVSISLIVFLIIQTLSIIWFAAKLTGQVEQNTSDIAIMKADEKDREKARAEMIANLSAINQELRDMREIMIQSAGRTTQLVMPPANGGPPPNIIMQQAPAPTPQVQDRLSMPN
jgi:hypothetical protein